MKKLNLKLGSIKEMLSKEQMKKITGGYHLACQCVCNSGIGYQPSFDWYGYPEYPGEEDCGCYTLLMVSQPGFNSVSCTQP